VCPLFLDRPLRTGKPFAKRPRAAYAGGDITRPTGRSSGVRELDVTFGDDP
jgi:hypothetical protein